MPSPTPTPKQGFSYMVKEKDTLSGIAQQAYLDESLWLEIYIANAQVIGSKPEGMQKGITLYISVNPQQTRRYLTVQSCIVTAGLGLNARVRATAHSTVVGSYAKGTVLNFVEVVQSETVEESSYWGVTAQGHYFWMGGTNRPNG